MWAKGKLLFQTVVQSYRNEADGAEVRRRELSQLVSAFFGVCTVETKLGLSHRTRESFFVCQESSPTGSSTGGGGGKRNFLIAKQLSCDENVVGTNKKCAWNRSEYDYVYLQWRRYTAEHSLSCLTGRSSGEGETMKTSSWSRVFKRVWSMCDDIWKVFRLMFKYVTQK